MARYKSSIWTAGLCLALIIGATGTTGCESQQKASSSAAVKSRFPQTSKPIIVDAKFPPKDGAKVIKTYEDAAYGKTELRDDDYHRHWDPIANNWTPWHHRHYPHRWGDAPVAVAPAPAPATPVHSNTATGVFGGAKAKGAVDADCCGPVVLEKSVPAEVSVGEEYTFTIKATNAGSLAVKDVRVSDEIVGDFTASKSDPQAEGQGAKMTWNLGELKPGESKTITVTGKATKAGQVTNCATVAFTPVICTTTNVIEPALKLVKTMPEEVLLCDNIPIRLVVTNTGTGTARGVTVEEKLPEGLVTAEGAKSSVTLAAGDLASGQSKEFTVLAKPTKTGVYTNTATAKAGALTAEATAKVTVRQPKLEIAKTGPKEVFVGRDVTYKITVKNVGDASARDTIVTDALGTGVSFVSASDGGVNQAGVISWNLGALAVNASKELSVTVRPTGKGAISNRATAKAYCADAVTAGASSEIKGIAAILIEVIDLHDPIEVGDNETYEIEVTNQGSAPDTNIKIVANLEDAQSYVSSQGPTQGTVAGKTVTFQPLPSLAPGAKTKWQVVVKAEKAGDVRFKVTMTSDQLTRPVEETEATNQYQ